MILTLVPTVYKWDLCWVIWSTSTIHNSCSILAAETLRGMALGDHKPHVLGLHVGRFELCLTPLFCLSTYFVWRTWKNLEKQAVERP